jgi:hypothetical protein
MTRRCAGILFIAAAALPLGGCDRATGDAQSGKAGPATTTSYTTSASRAAATSPATTQAAESLLNIDGTLVLFPAAKLRIDEADGKVVARLFSDDPQHALDENYDGNSFYLQIEIDPADAKDLDGVTLKYSAPGTERDDTPYGVFLEGRRWVLQPANLTFTFAGSAPSVDVAMNGTFLLFDTSDATAKPKQATVTGKISAAVQPRK